MRVDVYTDGSCLRNPGGAGGFAAIAVIGKKELLFSGGFRSTTNNRMEMMAVAVALEGINKPAEVHLWSDSKIVVNGVNFPKNQGKKKKPIPNYDLWLRIYRAAKPHAVFAHWVQGHNGHHFNERCDRQAAREARSLNLQDDQGYLERINPPFATLF